MSRQRTSRPPRELPLLSGSRLNHTLMLVTLLSSASGNAGSESIATLGPIANWHVLDARLRRTGGVCNHDGFFTENTAPKAAPVSNCTFVSHRDVAAREGGVRMEGAPLVLTGCARRIAERLSDVTIPYADALMKAASARGLSPSILIFQDDPTDNATLAVLEAWAARQPRVRLILADMGERGERIQRLALCRNVLLAEASAYLAPAPEAPPSPVSRSGFVASIDLDCRHGLPENLLRAIDEMDTTYKGFDVVTANNWGAYRDMWALRSKRMGMDYDCFWDFARMRRQGNCKMHQIFVHPDSSAFEVDAAFNGMAIFRAASLTSPRVRGDIHRPLPI